MRASELREEIHSPDAQSAWDVLVEGFASIRGLQVEARRQGFLNSLRVRRGRAFLYAVIPNDQWVLAYVRKPALAEGRLTPGRVMASFPAARWNNAGEVTLRIRDAATASRWIDMIRDAG